MNDAGALHPKKPVFGKMPEKLMHDGSITDGACRLFSHMHWRYGQNKQNFEGRESIAKMLGISETTVTNRIMELEAKDWVVVILRDRDGKGNYKSHFYHIFESQSMCRQFRESYVPQEGEKVREKVAVEPRKTRQGVGGRPSHKAKSIETQVPLGNDANHRNSSSVHARNSSSHYLDSLYPDSFISFFQKEMARLFKDGISLSIRLLEVRILRIAVSMAIQELQKVPPETDKVTTLYTPVFIAVAKHIQKIPDPTRLSGKPVGIVRSIEKEIRAQFECVFGEYNELCAAYAVEQCVKGLKYVPKYAAPFAVEYLAYLQRNEAKLIDIMLNGVEIQVPATTQPTPPPNATPAAEEDFEAYERMLNRAGGTDGSTAA